MKQVLIRNEQASRLTDSFLISGVSSILLLRFYLHLTGYPTVGGTKYHIAHMLYGGILMVIALGLSLLFLGERRKVWVAIIGGAGFGVFIDEVGKFITRDNNYFFRPSIGIIYAAFVALYLAANFFVRPRRLSSQEYQMNALVRFQEAIHHDMDPHEKSAVRHLLAAADPSSIITKQLQILLQSVDTVKPPKPNVVRRLINHLDMIYTQLWLKQHSNQFIQIFFIVQTIIFVILVGSALENNIDNVRHFLQGDRNYGHALVIGQLIGTVVAASLTAVGIIRLGLNRLAAFDWFRRALQVNILFTEFFIFSRIQFGALPSFLFNIGLLLLVNFVLQKERQIGSGKR